MAVSDPTLLTDEDLTQEISKERKAFRQLVEAEDPREEGQRREILTGLDVASQRLDGMEAEVRRRQHSAFLDGAPIRRALREREDDRARRRDRANPIQEALSVIRQFAHAELMGLRLVGSNLTHEEAVELRALAKARLRYSRSLNENVPAEPLSDVEESRYLALVGRLAGDEHLFPRKARERDLQAKAEALADAERRATTPEFVQLPTTTLMEWLVDPEEGGLDVPTLGVLSALLLSFASRKPVLAGAEFQGDAMVVRGPLDQVRFVRGANPSGLDDVHSPGRVRLAPAVTFLRLNGLVEIQQQDGRVEIRLGSCANEIYQAEGGEKNG